MPKRHAYTRFNLLPSAVIFLLIACSWTTSEDLPPTNLPVQKKPETFTNPILPAPSADPWMIQHNGVYYYAESRDGGIYVRTSTLIVDVAKDSGTRVWVPPRSGLNSREIWAPELHRIGGRWYIYFAADDGVNAHHKMWVA